MTIVKRYCAFDKNGCHRCHHSSCIPSWNKTRNHGPHWLLKKCLMLLRFLLQFRRHFFVRKESNSSRKHWNKLIEKRLKRITFLISCPDEIFNSIRKCYKKVCRWRVRHCLHYWNYNFSPVLLHNLKNLLASKFSLAFQVIRWNNVQLSCKANFAEHVFLPICWLGSISNFL